MMAPGDLPLWLAVPAALLLVLGGSLTLLGAIGLVRLQSFYDRLHAPTLGASWGAAAVLLASILLFSWAEGRLVLHDLLIGIFILMTTPITTLLLTRAALYRDRHAGRAEVPARLPPPDALPEAPPATPPANFSD